MKYMTVCLLTLLIMSCKSSKPGTNHAATPVDDKLMQAFQNMQEGSSETVEGAEAQDKLKSMVWRLIVEFYSIGEGTDLEARKRFDAYISKWHEAGNPKATYIAVPWGREGEVDFCFTLSELAPDLQQNFIQGLREQMSSSRLVRLTENEKCSHFR